MADNAGLIEEVTKAAADRSSSSSVDVEGNVWDRLQLPSLKPGPQHGIRVGQLARLRGIGEVPDGLQEWLKRHQSRHIGPVPCRRLQPPAVFVQGVDEHGGMVVGGPTSSLAMTASRRQQYSPYPDSLSSTAQYIAFSVHPRRIDFWRAELTSSSG